MAKTDKTITAKLDEILAKLELLATTPKAPTPQAAPRALAVGDRVSGGYNYEITGTITRIIHSGIIYECEVQWDDGVKSRHAPYTLRRETSTPTLSVNLV